MALEDLLFSETESIGEKGKGTWWDWRVEIGLTSHHTLLLSHVWTPPPPPKSLGILGAPFQVLGTTILKVWWAALNWEFAAMEEGGLPSSCSSSFWFFPFPCANSCTPAECIQLSKQVESTLLFAGCGFSDHLLSRINSPKVRQASKPVNLNWETIEQSCFFWCHQD